MKIIKKRIIEVFNGGRVAQYYHLIYFRPGKILLKNPLAEGWHKASFHTRILLSTDTKKVQRYYRYWHYYHDYVVPAISEIYQESKSQKSKSRSRKRKSR